MLQKNPQAPTLKAQNKIHKLGDPIRPVINNMNDPAYKIFKHLVNEQNKYLNLDHQITTKNSINLEEIVTKLKLNSNYRMSIYDIKIYTLIFRQKKFSGLINRYSQNKMTHKPLSRE